LPDLGEIPPPSPRAAEGEDVEEDDEDEDDDDDDDADDSDDDGAKRRKKRRGNRPSTSHIGGKPSVGGVAGKAADDDTKANEADPRKKRGRPPRVDTPMEARIKSVLRGLRKLRSDTGEMKIAHFEKLPDKAAMPEYFQQIKTPMAVDLIKVSNLVWYEKCGRLASEPH
jgi:chromatin structure-remodeling complex subunit RSC1/2